MKKTKIFYWIFTSLFILLMGFSGIENLINNTQSVEFFKQLGLPAYLPPFLGAAKLLGVIAILIPGYPRIKEWAYAGLVFDLAGATWCVVATTPAGAGWAFMLLPFILAFGSYFFYHKKSAQPGNSQSRFVQSLA
ncbi:MAG TPA: DoxX family protein [Puia sp.]|jgi:hypothetical protein|nr:DoxX family protein [Puia sp.]